MKKDLIVLLKNTSEELKKYIKERDAIELSKENIKVELASAKTAKNLLISQNNEYDEQIEKIKLSSQYIKICTTIFNIFLIFISIIATVNLLTPLFLPTLALIPIMTIVYICVIYKDVVFLKNHKIKFFRNLKNINNRKVKDIDDKIKELEVRLQDILNKYNDCTQYIKSRLDFKHDMPENYLAKRPLTK